MSEEEVIKCPYCGVRSLASVLKRHVFSQEAYTASHSAQFLFNEKALHARALVCANAECRQSSLWMSYFDGEGFKTVRLEPKSQAKAFPEYIPEGIREDYGEACLILEDSPKAAAALARRCLQGMIRDFWGIKKNTLYDEIKSLEDKIPSGIYRALLGLKDVGNSAAHPTAEIVDIPSGHAQQMVTLLEILFDEWYVARDTKNQNIAKVGALAMSAKNQKQEQGSNGPTP